MATPQFDPRPDGIGHAIQDRRPVVPIRQRSYKWEEEDVKKLFEDLNAAFGESEYFLGLIVAAQEGSGRPEVVDGQQRLATTTILLAAIRDYMLAHDTQIAQSIEDQYLQSFDIDEETYKPHMRLNHMDNDYFVARVLAKPDSAERKKAKSTVESHDRIDKAAIAASDHVKIIVAGLTIPDGIKRLKKWVAFLRDKVRVIWFAVPNAQQAYTIFETMNDRGVDMSKADLLKNHLFSCAGTDEQEIDNINQHWQNMIGALHTVSVKEELATTYVRHLWISLHGPTRTEKLYDSIKSKVRDKAPAIQFALQLATRAVDYAAILNPDHEKWIKHGSSARKNLGTLNMLRMERMRPLQLSIVEKFPIAEAKKAFSLLVSWAVRWLIAGAPAGTVEKELGEAAQLITDGKIISAKALAKGVTVFPGDRQFEDAFAVARSSQPAQARYYLRCLERAAKGQGEAMIPTDDEEVLTLEHVWPKSPPPSAKKSPGDLAELNDMATRIGNMALMRKPLNEEVANKPFKEKKKYYAEEQGLLLTVDLGNYTKWGKEQIEDRQRKMAKLAVKAWPATGS